jgi:RND family efflux transporter MFP subunit
MEISWNGGISMKSFKRRWLWLIGILAVILLFVLLMIPKKKDMEPPAERRVIDAKVITLQMEELPVHREATGVVTSAHEATLASKVVGLVEDIRVREGDQVKAGEVLTILDSRDLQAQLERAGAELKNATAQYQRMKQLYAEESVAKQELDNAERAYKVAEAARKEIEAHLAYTTIRAPFDGIVTEKSVEVGELVTAGRPLLRMVDNRHLRLEVTVAETEIGALRAGETVMVRLDALGDQVIAGRVAQIRPSADPSTHSFAVKVDLPSLSGLKSGLFGRVLFPIGSRKTVMLPLSAVLERGSLSYVYVVNEARMIESRLVKLGKAHRDRIESLSGLESGEQIVEHAQEGIEGALVQTLKGGPS